MDDSLRLDELTPVGGTWTGLLFENPASGRELALSYTFSFNFAEVNRYYGSVSPNLVIDWVPAGNSGWRAMSGQSFSCSKFGDPIEASVYFFEHHRYDSAELAVLDQEGSDLTARAQVAGDIDGLRLPDIRVSATLTFAGIFVQAEAVGTDQDAARELLTEFTDIGGLHARSTHHNVVFAPPT